VDGVGGKIVYDKVRDDLLHVAWGVWIALVVLLVPWFALAAPLAVLPRELEQTYHALEEKTWAGFKRHIAKDGWLEGKLRDLAGFALGGLAFDVWG
jgi:hypothetical protein